MIRLHITAEGQTEQGFANKMLRSHLAQYQVMVSARCVLTSRDRRTNKEYRGGLYSYERVKNDIQDWIKGDNHAECRFTTMFDFYALPKDFPGYEEAKSQQDPYQKVKILEEYLQSDIGDWRFIPYIQLHEFEALILADPQKLEEEYLDQAQAIANLITMVGGGNPELINDGPSTAPSKRILKEIPGYSKSTAGPAVTERIGIEILREKCPHFNGWISLLEQLNGTRP